MSRYSPTQQASWLNSASAHTPSRSPLSRNIKLGTDDVSLLRSSSSAHFRHLSKAGSPGGGTDDFYISGVTDSKEDVAGLQGRIRLARAESTVSQVASKNWMDKQRKNIQAYEYLCHIGEAKEWIEACIEEDIPPIVQLEEKLRDGVVLAKLTKVFAPHLVRKIFESPRLQFRHSENINYFFKFLDEMGMPELFTFELTDLYDKKNVPKVIYCVHALGYILSSENLAPAIGSLIGKLEFTEDEIRDTQRGLDKAGVSVPNFKGMNKHFGVEPEVSEEERMAVELAASEDQIAQLQAAVRGNLYRLNHESDLYTLRMTAPQITQLNAVFRGNALRASLHDQQSKRELYMRHLPRFQAHCKGALKRLEFDSDKYEINYYWPDHVITSFQSAIRGQLSRKREANRIGAIKSSSASHMATRLQAACRGALVRAEHERKVTNLERESKSRVGIVAIQALVRGRAVRDQLDSRRSAITNQNHEWVSLQAAARGILFRKKEQGLKEVLRETQASVILFQALARGHISRKQGVDTSKHLVGFKDSITELQAVIRARNLRADVTADLDCLYSYEFEFKRLQAQIRGLLIRRKLLRDEEVRQDSESWIKEFQAFIRGHLLRSRIEELYSMLPSGHELNTIARGHLVRREINEQRQNLKDNEHYILTLQSTWRAGVVRKEVGDTLERLDFAVPCVVRLQSIFRGIMVRFDYMLMREEFEEELDTYIMLQAGVRGYLVRKKFNDRMQHFNRNMDKVIKIQSFIRAKKQGDAYKSLITGANPPLSTVKSFVHLLNDSDLDFEQEVELEQSRKRVIDEVRNNEMLEQFITQLDVKIALLLKNKITLDELIKHRNKGVKGNFAVTTATDMFDLKALNKASRRRLELYQGFFYILQTQPAYLARLFFKLRQKVISEKEAKDVESLVMTIYGHAQQRREEFFLLQLIGRSIREEMEHAESSKIFLRGNYIWWKLIAAINRNTKERKFLKNLLRRPVSLVVDGDVSLESDPLTIYRTLINNEELSTGKLSHRDSNVAVDEAIQDPETRATFVGNLQHLRELTTEFLTELEQNIDVLPYHIRFIAMVVYKSAREKFEKESEDRILSLVGHIVFTNYLNPAIIAADSYGIARNALGPQQSKNLSEVTKMLSQIASLKLFSKENVYLQPLNDYVKVCVQKMKKIFRQIITVPELEQEYEMNVFDDLTSHQRPTLYVKTSDTFAIHSLVCQELDFIAPAQDDSLRDVVNQLGELPNDASEILNIARFTEVKLDLNPSFCRVEDPEAEVNSLMVAAKRCLVYVLRVQSGADLLDILLSPVLPEHEEKYKAILREERREKNQKVAYSASALGDLSRINYRELKLLALEKVIELESYGKITRENRYQDVLNSIAMDIKTKRNRRVSRQKESDSIKQTLTDLAEKEAYLQQQLKTYNDYIEQAMSTLQTKKGKKKNLVIPFTRQYFHMRDLQKTGRVPKFGSYKYTAANLFEKGVLVELNGYSERQHSQVSFTFSSDQVGMFNIEAAFGSIALPGASIELTLDDLLGQQYNNRQYITLFDDMVKFNTNLMLHFIFRKFYGEA